MSTETPQVVTDVEQKVETIVETKVQEEATKIAGSSPLAQEVVGLLMTELRTELPKLLAELPKLALEEEAKLKQSGFFKKLVTCRFGCC